VSVVCAERRRVPGNFSWRLLLFEERLELSVLLLDIADLPDPIAPVFDLGFKQKNSVES